MSEKPETFLEKTERYFRAAGPVRWGVKYRMNPWMPMIWFHEASNYRKGTGPFQTREEAETLYKLLVMSKNHEGKRAEVKGDSRAASAAWSFQFEVGVFHVPAIATTLEEERQIELDERMFPRQSAA